MKNRGNMASRRRFLTGFTLVELMVVIAIIGILTTVILSSLGVSRMKARDAQRMSDMTQIQLALEQYYDDNAAYPLCGTTAGTQFYCCSTGFCPSGGTWAALGSNLAAPVLYLRAIPNDPVNTNAAYGYYYARGYRKTSSTGACSAINTGLSSDYVLATRLEGPNHPCSSFSGITWNNTNLNVLIGN